MLRQFSALFLLLLIGCSLLAMMSCGSGTAGLITALQPSDDDDFIPLSQASIDESAVLLTRDQWRGIPIPYRLTPEGRVPADAVIQWRYDDQSSFPALPEDTEVLRAALRDPEESARLQICTEIPSGATGLISSLPANLSDDGRSVRILALGDLESWALAEGIIGQELQIQRPTDSPRLSDVPSRAPRGAVPIGDGSSAIVFDSSGSGFRLREMELSTGETLRTIVSSGSGNPNQIIPLGTSSVVVATHVGDDWTLREIDLTTGDIQSTLPRPDSLEVGEIKGLASLGGRSILFTVGNSLIEWAIPESGNPPEPIVHFNNLNDPRGIAVNQNLGRRGVYVAETGENRVRLINLLNRSWSAVTSVDAPQSIALDRGGRMLLAITDNQAQAGLELRGIPLRGPSSQGTDSFEILIGLSGRNGNVVVGPNSLRLVSLRENSEILVSGGIEQVRVVESYDSENQVAKVDREFDPPLNAVQSPRRWKILDRVQAVLGSTQREVFVWNSSDAKSSGRVIFGITPFDTRKGETVEIRVGKSITSDIDSVGIEVENETSDLFNDPTFGSLHDMDGDGDLDLVVATRAGGQVVIVPQTSPGVFDTDPSATTILTDGLLVPRHLDIADFDADGRLDILVANGSGELTVFVQQDAGVFTSTNLVNGPRDFGYWAMFANMDPSDNELEIVAAQVDDLSAPTQGSVVVVNPNGADLGDFTTTQRNSERIPSAIAVADLNGDSRLDIVAATCVDIECTFNPVGWNGEDQGRCEVFLQNASAFTFQSPRIYDLGEPNPGTGPLRPFSIGVEDVDGDGDYDVALCIGAGRPSKDRVRLFLNTGTGLNNNQFLVFEGAGYNGPTSVSLVDMNGDGLRDIVTSNFGGSRDQDPGGLTISFQPLGGFVVDESDLDEEGNPTRVVIPQDPDTRLTFPSLVSPEFVFPADLNGDGRVDLIASSFYETLDPPDPGNRQSEGSIVLFVAKEPGSYPSAPDFFGVDGDLRNPTVAAGDFNGDGLLDVVTANASSELGGQPEGGNSLTVFFQEFLGQIDPSAKVILGDQEQDGFPLENPFDVIALDIDGDGAQDFAVVANVGNNVAIYRQIGGGEFDEPITLQSDDDVFGIRNPIAIAGADYDRDGDVDLVIANGNIVGDNDVNGNVLVLPQDDSGSFCLEANCGAMVLDAPDPREVILAEVTGDGRPDAIVATGVDVRIFDLTLGGGPIILTDSLATPFSIASGDLNRDGFVDIAVTNSGDDSVVVFFQEQGAFPNALVLEDASFASSDSFVAIADVNSDGVQDIITANRQQTGGVSDGSLTVIRQISNGVFAAPTVLRDPALSSPRGILPVDLDRDSDIDLVVPINATSADGILVFFGGQ